MKKVFYSILACLVSLSCQGQKSEQVKDGQKSDFVRVSANEFDKVLTDTAIVLLDVRTADEYAAGHIKGTRWNIDVLKPDFDSLAVSQLQKDKTVALYCRSGNRSKRAAQILTSKGYRVIELSTGYNGWVKAGLPVE